MASSTPRSNALPLLLFLAGLGLGGGLGFGAGVLSVRAARSFILGLFESEARADAAHPQTIDRAAFRLQYPGNWTLDTADSDHEPDHLFTIDSPGDSFVMFVITDGDVEPEAALAAQVDQFTAKTMRNATRAPFDRWGAYPGRGMLLSGNHLGMLAGTIRIFSFRGEAQTYTVVEHTFDEDRHKVQPGFDLVERTFEVKRP